MDHVELAENVKAELRAAGIVAVRGFAGVDLAATRRMLAKIAQWKPGREGMPRD